MKVSIKNRRLIDVQEAHFALIKAETREPGLSQNPAWILLRQDAYERYAIEFGKVK